MQQPPVISPASPASPRRLLARATRTAFGLATGAVAVGLLTGCEVDTFMDPSQTGRWEQTATVMPILEQLASIEPNPIELVPTDRIQAADLIPEIEEYRIASGDVVQLQILDFDQPGVPSGFESVVDERGFIDIPGLPGVYAEGLTKHEVAERVRIAVREAGRLNDAQVSVVLGSQRRQTYSVIGAVTGPGAYFIPSADFRLLDAVARSGQFDQNLKHVYVIRQVPLTDAVAGRLTPPEPGSQGKTDRPWGSQPSDQQKPADGEELLDLIQRLSGEERTPQRPSPGVLSSNRPSAARQPSDGPPIDLPGSGGNRPSDTQPPPIDLPETSGSGLVTPRDAAPPIDLPSSSTDFVFRDGRWVRSSGAEAPGEGLLTQRVIQVPVDQLLAGRADVNIIIRPGDVIRFPAAQTGLVYMAGQISRPGPYGLPADGGRLTLQRAVDSAGGLTGLGIPERVDLTRVVGPGRQATIRLNLRAIAEQTQPDIYLKPDDRINVGTNFWAFPLAVIRSGFRASYGFGFLLDRNFGNDVFGAPPDSGS